MSETDLLRLLERKDISPRRLGAARWVEDRELIRNAISDEMTRRQALRYVEELRLADNGDDQRSSEEPDAPTKPTTP